MTYKLIGSKTEIDRMSVSGGILNILLQKETGNFISKQHNGNCLKVRKTSNKYLSCLLISGRG
jgi:hypothetical protein